MVEWLSSIKDKNLNGCGKLVLTGDMSTLSITKIDLSSMDSLEGKWCFLKASPEDPSQEPSSLLLAPSVFPPLYPGNIEVFKDMQIKELNLSRCYNLTGEWCVGWMKLRG